jgi:hypothetical protein
MSVNDASRTVLDISRVMLQIVASLADNSRGVIYNHNMFIVEATGVTNFFKSGSKCILDSY